MKTGLRFLAAGLLMAVFSIGTTCQPRSITDESPNHEDAFSREGLLTANATDLKATVVSGTLDVPMAPGTNVLWCGTFQLAWNEIGSLIGDDPRLPEPSLLVDGLNKKSFTKNDLDDASYVALAGLVGDGIHERIGRALRDKFGGQARPRFLPSKNLTPRPQDIVAYAYLFKNLEFPTPFERLDRPLVFGGKEVAAFGMGEFKPGHWAMVPQVMILDYRNENDFVIELKTKSEWDRVILAKTALGSSGPGATLAAMVAEVERRASAKGEQASLGDSLTIPKFNFDLTRRYVELENHPLVSRNPNVAGDLFILSALQNTRFQMDEKGVKLRSESHISVGCAAEKRMQPQHRLIFDRPFLIMLQRDGTASPYFALWVDNPELLVPWQVLKSGTMGP